MDNGRHLRSWSAQTPGEVLLVDADGRKELGGGYAALGAGARVACFTPHYGSSPVSPAFDLAAAALMLKDGTTFATPQANDFSAQVTTAGKTLGTDRISCLTLGEDDGFGLVRLKREETT